MEHETEPKKRKKKIVIFNDQHNQSTLKFEEDYQKKLNMTKSHLKLDPDTSSNNIKVFSRTVSRPKKISTLNNGTTRSNEHRRSNSLPEDFIGKLNSTNFNLNSSKPLRKVSSSRNNKITFNFDMDSDKNLNTNEVSNSNSLENSNNGNTLKPTNLTQFMQSENVGYVCCSFCHIIICDDNTKLTEHALKCKKLIETNFSFIKNYHCLVCNLKMKSIRQWKLHAISIDHIDKCKSINDYVSYDCGGCKVVFFGNKDQILSHCKNVHKNPSGLPCIFKCMKEVFSKFIFVSSDKWKSWMFCGPCRKYSTLPINCHAPNHTNRKTKQYKCNTCSIDFICNQDVYVKHLLSCEHIMMEYLRTETNGKYELQSICNLKLLPMFLSKFTVGSKKVTCNDCKCQMEANEKTILVHLSECIVKSDLGGKNTTQIKSYFCAVCNELTSDFSQWKFHLISPSHLIKCYGINDLVSYTCELCSLHCYGNGYHVTEHQNIHPNNSEKNLSKFMALNFQRINKDLKSKQLYYCEACETNGEINLNSDHWSKSHKAKLKREVCQSCRIEFFCVEGKGLFDKHVLSSEHIILKYTSTQNLLLESKPSSDELNEENKESNDSENRLETIQIQVPLVNKSYLNWFKNVEDKNKVSCRSCGDLIDKNENALLSHLLSCDQFLTEDIFKMVVNYFKCLECLFESKNYESWVEHVISHLRLDIYDLYSYFCKICCSLIYGKINDIELHFNNEHQTIISEMPLETVLMAKQLMTRKNKAYKPGDIMSFCEPCKKMFKANDNSNHFNTDSHASVASDLVELFYCKYCQVEFYSSSTVFEYHKLTAEHIILSLEYSSYEIETLPKPFFNLDSHLFKFATNQTLYSETQNIGFFCFVCDYMCCNLNIWKTHINGKKHLQFSKKSLCMDHRCKICKTLMFGQRQYMLEHYNNRLHSMLRQLKLETSTDIKKKVETNPICNVETTSKDIQIEEGASNILGESISNIHKIQQVTNIMDRLSLESKGNSILEESTTDKNKEHLAEKTLNAVCLKSNTQNYTNFCKLKVSMYYNLLKKNEDIKPQFSYHCVPCDFITALQTNWDEHTLIDHSKNIESYHKIFCSVCNLYQFGPSTNLDEHNITNEHKNMVDFHKFYNSHNINKMNTKTIAKNVLPDKQETVNNTNDEKEATNRKVMIEIKGAKPQYKKNGWVELKKIFSAYGYFGISARPNSVLIIFRKMSAVFRMLKDKEQLEKSHEFTISVIEEDYKLPELQMTTKCEFGNKEILLKNVDTQMIAISQEIANSNISHRLFLLINAVLRCASQYFLNAKIYAFGSRMSGLALKDSDVDLYFDIANTFHGSLSNDLNAQEDLVRYFGKVFRSQHNEFKQIFQITGARVPIVKFFHYPSGLNCDLSFKSGLSTHNTKLVRLYLTLDNRVHWVVCAVVKRWALQNDLKNQSMFTSYALVWLVLFYLMTIGVVPPLKLLRDHAVYSNSSRNQIPDEMFIEDWDCTFCSPEKAKRIWKVPEIPCWDLLFGFFKFYSDPGRLKQFVFCPAIGEAIPKDKFVEIPTKNSDILGFYKKKIGNASLWRGKLRSNFLNEGLAVQDPFDLFHNITKTIIPRKLQDFSHLCKLTLEVMNKGIQPYYA